MTKPTEMLNRGACVLVLALLTGCLLTLGIQKLIEVFGHGENIVGFWLLLPWELMLAPARIILAKLGWSWNIGSVYEVPPALLYSAAIINAILFALIVAVLIRLIRIFKTRKGKVRP